MKDLILKSKSLPAKAEDLQRFILIGKEALKAQKAKIQAIEKADMAKVAKEAAISDTQDMAEILLDAEVRLGEILEKMNLGSRKRTQAGKLSGAETPLPNDIDKKQSHYAQKLAKHPEIIEKEKIRARKEGRIVTAAEVIGQIERHDRKPRPVEELLSEEFDTAFELFLKAVKNQKGTGWKVIPKERALQCLSILKRIIGEEENV